MSPIYERPVWQIMIECIEQMPDTFTVDDVVRWLANQYPKINRSTASMQLRGACVNLALQPTMRSGRPQRLAAYKLNRSHYTRYRPEVHGEFDDRGLPVGSTDFDVDEEQLTDAQLSDALSPEAAEFALEAHLEDFLEANWGRVDFGVPLSIYAEDGVASGRQYRTDIGIIDFLCRNTNTGDYWVIELKRGQSSDSVVGQILRYMGWVKENLAHGSEVHGLVIAHEQDERLRYAVKMVPNVQAWTYRVSFDFIREGVAV